ncbi:hypothetical protein PENARI_c001G00647 [Penicillium arizonense]|uniref:Zn(2)-C6 fungal-type domain-containing protein n=1 Tax=Penicillium arizonense TaxID=1835702 RepID=A0A1F5LYB5_PENAI|nr:hypothetical protein PENARI_c001G00647 [Penicillium arizonense]OGE58167.1 hypothetical protein PENARI_c001G00647 [Penicillium arizonense]
MVGVPRSNGCLRCVKRRVKCDQRLPGCAKCETYGQPCPGYDRGFKFITGKPYRDRRRPASDKKDGTPKSATSSPEIELESACQTLIKREEPYSLISSDVNVMQHLCVLIDDFSQPITPSTTHVVTRWFGFLPSIYGQNRVLDATIRCFTAHHFGRLAENLQMVSYARLAYGEALRGLRKSLETPAESLSTHVFCAVVLLCMYELFTDTDDPESWMKHAKGLSQLVQIRGPDRYSNALDISLLKASRGLIVMHSMFSGEECFLVSDEWHEKMRQQFTTDLPPDLHHCIEVFFAYFTHAPSLVHKLYGLRHMDVASAAALQTITELLSKALEMQANLAIWYEQFSQIAPPPFETLSPTGDELYPVILTYTDVNQATIYCGYYSFMAIIHEILKTCCQPGQHAAMVIYFRDQICKSVEYTSVGIMGPYRMGFPLRVAFEIADPVTRSWILNRLGQFSKIYAAAQPENYKPVL